MQGKIDETVTKLEKLAAAYSELVVVTPRIISTERQLQMKQDARKKYGISLNIYERKTLLNRLSDFNNGIYYRHFPTLSNNCGLLCYENQL